MNKGLVMKTLLGFGIAFAGAGVGVFVTYLFGLAYGLPLKWSDMTSHENLPFMAVAIVGCLATTIIRELFGRVIGGPFSRTVDMNRWAAITAWSLVLVILVNLYILPYSGSSFWAMSLVVGNFLPMLLYNDLEKSIGTKKQFALQTLGVSVLMLLAAYAVAWVHVQL